MSGKKIDGITDKPANRVEFDCAEMGDRKVNVVDYFWHKHNIRVQYPELPCIQLGNPRNCIPMEFVYVMGGLMDCVSRGFLLHRAYIPTGKASTIWPLADSDQSSSKRQLAHNHAMAMVL